MQAIPFIYFSLLVVFLYRKRKKIDLSIYIMLLYAVTGFFSIFVRGIPTYSISLVSAISYCFLHTLCIFPIIKFADYRVFEIGKVKNEKLLKIIAWLAFISFLAYFAGTISTVVDILSGDLRALRNTLYEEGSTGYGGFSNYPIVVRVFFLVTAYLFGCGWVFIFLAFYSLLIQKLPKIYFFLFIIASLSSLWKGIMNIDRSAAAMYVISFMGTVIYFWPYMEKKIKSRVSLVTGLLLGVIFIYLFVISFARFGGVDSNDSSAVEDSFVQYIGQNYYYFCYFFDTFDNPYKMSNLLFPFINHFIFRDEVLGGFRINEFFENKLGMETGYFYTYLGQIQLTAGHLVAILFAILLCLISYSVLNRKIYRRVRISGMTSFLYVFFASFSMLGVFYYYYQQQTITSSVVFFLIMFRLMGPSKVYVKKSKI